MRIIDSGTGTAAKTRVLVVSSDGHKTWGTVGVSTNIIDAAGGPGGAHRSLPGTPALGGGHSRLYERNNAPSLPRIIAAPRMVMAKNPIAPHAQRCRQAWGR